MSDRPTCKCRSCMAPQTLVMRLELAAALTSRRARFRFETLGPSEVTLLRWGEHAPKEAQRKSDYDDDGNFIGENFN